jgi:glycosyltransferase involved in cell wall biosynthesis
MPGATVSVIIPVYNDPDGLRSCLAALSRQSYPAERVEVLVVDNGSSSDLSSVTRDFEGIRLLHEDRAGSYYARNRGLSEARGDVIAFIDADCVPTPDWIRAGVEAIGGEQVGLAVGRVELSFRDPEHLTAVELHEQQYAFPQASYAQDHFGATANVFTRRVVVDKVGGFDSSLMSGGDKEWGRRIHHHGFQVVYAPDACVVHPARSTWGGFAGKIMRCVCGDLDRASRDGVPLPRILADQLWHLRPPLLAFLRVWTDARLSGPRTKLKFLATIVFSRLTRARAVLHWLLSRTSPR